MVGTELRMNTRFNAVEERLGHFRSRLTNMSTSASKMQWNQVQFIRDSFIFLLICIDFTTPVDIMEPVHARRKLPRRRASDLYVFSFPMYLRSFRDDKRGE